MLAALVRQAAWSCARTAQDAEASTAVHAASRAFIGRTLGSTPWPPILLLSWHSVGMTACMQQHCLAYRQQGGTSWRHAPGWAQLSGSGPASLLKDRMRPESWGRAPRADQASGSGPDSALPDSMRSVRFWKAPREAQAGGRGPARLASVMERSLRAGKEVLEAQASGRGPAGGEGQWRTL